MISMCINIKQFTLSTPLFVKFLTITKMVVSDVFSTERTERSHWAYLKMSKKCTPLNKILLYVFIVKPNVVPLFRVKPMTFSVLKRSVIGFLNGLTCECNQFVTVV